MAFFTSSLRLQLFFIRTSLVLFGKEAMCALGFWRIMTENGNGNIGRHMIQLTDERMGRAFMYVDTKEAD